MDKNTRRPALLVEGDKITPIVLGSDDVSSRPVSAALLADIEWERKQAAWAAVAGDMKRLNNRQMRGRLRCWVENILSNADAGTWVFDHTQTYAGEGRFRILTEPYNEPQWLANNFASLVEQGWDLRLLDGVWSKDTVLVVLTSPKGVPLPQWKELGVPYYEYREHWGWPEINQR